MSFRREKYVPAGGPDGGDGGRGGDVVLVADSGDASLTGFRERRRFRASNGGAGGKNLRHGADGNHLTLHLPPGTLVRDEETQELIVDLDHPGARAVVAPGGRGGRGNVHFASATRQAPRIGELGERGTRRRIHLELKLIADVGLLGLPNAGKSTLLAALTGAQPKIAAYPFTTLHPNLGVANTAQGETLVIADVPGLVEGAHRGVGLGTDFLRHLERTRALVHLVDASQPVDHVEAAMAMALSELSAFSPRLASKPRLLALNKIDLLHAGEMAMLEQRFVGAQTISAELGHGCAQLLERAAELVKMARIGSASDEEAAAPRSDGEHRIYRHRPQERTPAVSREGDAFRVTAAPVERMVAMTDMDSDESVARLQRRLRTAGVDDALAAAGCEEGDTVRIGDVEFTYIES